MIRFLWHELRPVSRRTRLAMGELGPCYDLCACRSCWRGWTGVGPLRRLGWRVAYLLHAGYPA